MAVAERAPIAVAFVLDAVTGAVRGRVELPGAVPEVALDARGNQLVVLCESSKSPQLVAFDLDTLAERWRVSITDPHTTKATGGLPSLGVSRDGTFLFVQHSKALRADAEAPGGSRYWLSVHDAHNGAALTEVELPDCKAGSRLLAGAPTSVTVICKDGARTAEAPTWRVVRTIPVANLGPVALLDDTRLLGISTELQVLGLDLRTSETFEDSKWDEPATTRVTHWGRLTAAADGTRLWVMTRRVGSGSADQSTPDTLTEINLTTRKRIDTPVPDLRGVGLVGTRIVYFVQGRLRSTDGALDVQLLSGPVNYWGVFARTQGRPP
ncbi:MAG: hypothetical protein M3T56_11690 [Chloroflexota bacterium]|nr:hypothetical protein [Chloroflexota bacterium]